MTDTAHRAFFGDAERAFRLTGPMIIELERQTGAGIGTIVKRLVAREFSIREITETIRLALIGGGTHPMDALALVETYVLARPLVEGQLLAVDILDRLWSGAPAEPINHAAATGDLAAALSDPEVRQ